ncbi:MAG: hypothetical protein JWR23_3026 [Mucilaginibacter sp.]|nr:hypothetical protein [Mucilaginibacter sp.]
MAVNLARSFLYWHPDSNIKFKLVTDQKKLVPNDIIDRIEIVEILSDELGKGFSPKLHLDKLAPAGQTLFIDSDCLIYGNLLPIFEKFKGHHVSVIGNYIADGEWFGDIAAICKKFNIKHLPKFNGGIYYLENGPVAAQVYETARELEKQYDNIGFVRFRGYPADEGLMALSMQLNNQEPIVDDGTIMSDPLSCPGHYMTNVIKGENYLINPPAPHPLHQNWYPFTKISPLVVHFLGHHSMDYQYQKDIYRLKKQNTGQLNFIAETRALILIEFKKRLELFLKYKFRKIYHSLFGVRQIKPSERL